MDYKQDSPPPPHHVSLSVTLRPLTPWPSEPPTCSPVIHSARTPSVSLQLRPTPGDRSYRLLHLQKKKKKKKEKGPSVHFHPSILSNIINHTHTHTHTHIPPPPHYRSDTVRAEAEGSSRHKPPCSLPPSLLCTITSSTSRIIT